MAPRSNTFSILPKSQGDIEGVIHKLGKSIAAADAAFNAHASTGYSCNNPIDPASTRNWVSGNDQDNWYKVTFPNRQIYLTNYSITVRDLGCMQSVCCYRYPGAWILQGRTNNQSEWTDIHEIRSSGFTPQSDGKSLTYTVENPYFYQEIKLIHLGPHVNYVNCRNEYYNYVLFKIDFFGILKDEGEQMILTGFGTKFLLPGALLTIYLLCH